MKPLFNGRVAHLLMVVLFVSVGSSPLIAGEKDCTSDKWKDHPICTGTDPGDDVAMTLEWVNAWWQGDVHDQYEGGDLYEGLKCDGSGTISNGYVGHACKNPVEVHINLDPDS